MLLALALVLLALALVLLALALVLLALALALLALAFFSWSLLLFVSRFLLSMPSPPSVPCPFSILSPNLTLNLALCEPKSCALCPHILGHVPAHSRAWAYCPTT